MTVRNPAKEALGSWRAVPAELPRAWLKNDLSPYARMLGVELFRRCDDDYQGIVVTNDPWIDDVCRRLEICGAHRNAAKAALRALVDARLVRPLKGRIFIEMGQKGAVADAARAEPISNPDRITSKPRVNHVETTCKSRVNQQSTQTSEIVDIQKHRVGKEREGKWREGSRAREGVDERFGPMPPHVASEFRDKHAPPAANDPNENLRPSTDVGRLVAATWNQFSVDFWLTPTWEEPHDYDRLGKALEVSAAASKNTFQSVAKCALYRFAVLCYQHNSCQVPAIKWLFRHGKLSKCLHEGADANPAEYRLVSSADVAAGRLAAE